MKKRKVKVRKSWNVDPVTKVDKIKNKYSRKKSKNLLRKELKEWTAQ